VELLEEAEFAEVVIAARGQRQERVVSEIADLVFHLSLLMTEEGLAWRDVYGELEGRAK